MCVDKDGNRQLSLPEFRAAARKPTLDDLNNELRKAAASTRHLGPGTPGFVNDAAYWVGHIAYFEGWTENWRAQMVQLGSTLDDLQMDFLRTNDIRRSRLAQQLIDREHPKARAQKAEALFKWADKNRDEKLSLDEFKGALPEKDRDSVQQGKAGPNNTGKKAPTKRENRRKSRNRRRQNRS